MQTSTNTVPVGPVVVLPDVSVATTNHVTVPRGNPPIVACQRPLGCRVIVADPGFLFGSVQRRVTEPTPTLSVTVAVTVEVRFWQGGSTIVVGLARGRTICGAMVSRGGGGVVVVVVVGVVVVVPVPGRVVVVVVRPGGPTVASA